MTTPIDLAGGTILTIGHSTRSFEGLLELLVAYRVEEVVDVRRYPASRRHPHFASAALEASLGARRIGYRHEPDLGGRRRPRPGSPNTGWRSAAFRGYADHMDTPPFQRALDSLVRLGQEKVVTIMCAEAVPWRCHRQLIADALVGRGIAVRHIVAAGRTDPHTPPPVARVQPDGRVTYPALSAADGRGLSS